MPGDYSNRPVSDKPQAGGVSADEMGELDLRGVACPLSWAKAKVRLESLSKHEALRLRLDDARSARDIPRAAEAEGYAVLEVVQELSEWRIVIQR